MAVMAAKPSGGSGALWLPRSILREPQDEREDALFAARGGQGACWQLVDFFDLEGGVDFVVAVGGVRHPGAGDADLVAGLGG